MSARSLCNLAVIPARGGSKRLPRKNIADFYGKPILAYTLDAAREAQVFDRILVSTEDDEIAQIAQAYEGEVDRRPDWLATDQARVDELCIDLLTRLEEAGHHYDTLTVLYATAPLRTAADIQATLRLIDPGQCDFSMAACVFRQPFHQALHCNPVHQARPVFPENVTARANEMEKVVAGNGSTYSATVGAFLRARSFYGQPLKVHIMPWVRSIDIDTPDDLEEARFYYQRSQDIQL